MAPHRALRVALVQANRIVEERTFTGRARVTLGSDPKCTFLVPLGEVPKSTPVFECGREGAALLFDGQSDGQVSLDGAQWPLHSLSSRATRRGARMALPLPPDAKGRVRIGEAALLFQLVEPPKAPVRAALPKGARGLLAQIDRGFLAVLALSFGAHFAGVGYLSTQPVPEERDVSLADLPIDRFARAALPLPRPKPAPTTPGLAPAQPAAPSERPTPQAVAARVRSVGIVGVIGARGGVGSAFADILKDTGVSEVAAALEGAQGLSVASVEDATAGKRRGDTPGTTAQIDGLQTDGVREVQLGERGSTAVTGRVSTERIQVDTPDIPEDLLARWLQGRKPAIQSCYERELKRSPTLKGRLLIRFAIDGRGRVARVGFEEDTLRSAAVQQCITSVMRGWVLPFQPEDEVPVALPFVFSAVG